MSARASASEVRAAPAAAHAHGAALLVCAAWALAACGSDTASAATSPSGARPAETSVREPALWPAGSGPRRDMLGVTTDDDPVPPAPWLALELRFVEHDPDAGGARTTLVRLEEGVLRTRTHDEREGHDEPELEATVVLDEASTLELAASMRDAALLDDLLDVSELEAPAASGHVELAAVLERDAVRTRVVLERPATPRGVAALAAMERVVAIVQRATTPPAPPP